MISRFGASQEDELLTLEHNHREQLGREIVPAITKALQSASVRMPTLQEVKEIIQEFQTAA